MKSKVLNISGEATLRSQAAVPGAHVHEHRPQADGGDIEETETVISEINYYIIFSMYLSSVSFVTCTSY